MSRLSLRQKIEYLNARLAYMRGELALQEKEFPSEWKLCPNHNRIMRVMVDNPVATRQMLIDAQYWDKGEGPDCADETLSSQIMYMRRRLNKFGIEIITIRGIGYQLDKYFRAEFQRRDKH